ncbi:hypothetical protein IPL44_03255 [Candidatus Saccharibacteria bacterium]|nr:MAG: hypothetical protein IPL44_03255 [Candidatus Saccharibacteria bacterium]
MIPRDAEPEQRLPGIYGKAKRSMRINNGIYPRNDERRYANRQRYVHIPDHTPYSAMQKIMRKEQHRYFPYLDEFSDGQSQT